MHAGDEARGTARARLSRVLSLARKALLPVSLAAAAAIFLLAVQSHYPIQRWLFWIYAREVAWCALFALASVSIGDRALCALLGRPPPLRERLVLSTALGVLGMFLLLFLGGILGIFRPWLSVALPVVAALSGSLRLFRLGRRTARHIAAARRRARPPASALWLPAVAFGLGGVGLVWFAILSPRNIAFDAHFYHLGLAQQIAVEGGIRPSPEGWLPAAMPHLASVLYAWCFTLPGLDMFGRITCAAHLELALFVLTLASIPVLVRRLVPGAPARASWAAMFLFPGILLYDSSLTVAADHVAAFWAIPIWLALLRAWRTMPPRWCALLGAMLAGAILTKYQSIYVLAAPIAAMCGRAAWILGRRGWRRLRGPIVDTSGATPVAGLAAAAAMGLAMTAPHWLKNWIWYGDPLFPYLHRIFPPDRWAPDLGKNFELWSAWQSKSWKPDGTFGEKLTETLSALATFSFKPHDWPKFHGKVPVFGSLFTLSVLILPFLRGTKRIWALVVAAHVGVFIWYWTMHQDRYLQVLVPWMAVVVAATIALLWRTNTLSRALVSVLVGAQIVWGGDVYFFPTHAMTGASPARVTSDLLAQGHKKHYAQRLHVPGVLFDIGRARELPSDARILLHENNPRLGLWRPVVADVAGWQFALRYELYGSRKELYDALRKMGITHIVSREKSRRVDSLGADLRFFDFLEHAAVVVKAHGGFTLYRLPEAPPDDAAQGDDAALALYLGCGRWYEPGLHAVRDLSVYERQAAGAPTDFDSDGDEVPSKAQVKRPAREKAPKGDADLVRLAQRAAFLVTDAKCRPVPRGLTDGFVKLPARAKEQLWARAPARR